MLEEVAGRRLRAVERMAWHPADGSAPDLHSGSVHLWFDDGRCAHLTGRGDWTLRWFVTEAGDDGWLEQYDYEYHGRWVIRDASSETAFVDLVGRRLVSALPLTDEMDDVTGTRLVFDGAERRLRLWEGEIDTTPR